jgi:hypothetical protein
VRAGSRPSLSAGISRPRPETAHRPGAEAQCAITCRWWIKSSPKPGAIFEGETRHEDKILSLFEDHSAIIRKGKPDKPTEFGRLVRVDEVENGIVSGYAIAEGNPADQQQWKPALEHHQKIFGQAPRLAAADRGFWSLPMKNSLDLGVKRGGAASDRPAIG